MQNMLGFYHQQTRRKHGLTDTQLEHVQLSLGHRTLQLAGLRECSWSEPEKHVEFQFYWRQYESGETLDDGGMSAFRKATNYLRQAVLQRADAVVTTDIRENFRPAIALLSTRRPRPVSLNCGRCLLGSTPRLICSWEIRSSSGQLSCPADSKILSATSFSSRSSIDCI